MHTFSMPIEKRFKGAPFDIGDLSTILIECHFSDGERLQTL
jgi:hypothetical protein